MRQQIETVEPQQKGEDRRFCALDLVVRSLPHLTEGSNPISIEQIIKDASLIDKFLLNSEVPEG